jgi:hypothetical protein
MPENEENMSRQTQNRNALFSCCTTDDEENENEIMIL